MNYKYFLRFIFILLSFFVMTTVYSKITYIDKQVTGIGENYKMALRDAIREAISQVNGVTPVSYTHLTLPTT